MMGVGVEVRMVMDEEVRLREPNRRQLILQPVDYETLIGVGASGARDLAGAGRDWT